MNHNDNHDPEALTVARYHNHKTNSYTNSNSTPIWTGIFDPSFRVLILPRYLGVGTAIIPIPSSRRITSSGYEQEQQKLREQQQEQRQEEPPKNSESKNPLSSLSPTPSTHSSCSYSCCCSSELSHSTLRTSSSASDSSYTSISSTTISSTAISSTTISSTTNPTHPPTHPQNPNKSISEEQSLPAPQLSPKSLAIPDHFSEIQASPPRTLTPKSSLDMLSDSDSDCDDYGGVIDEDEDEDDFQLVMKDTEEEDSAICDLMDGFRKMSI
ncbi:uncharacterized protein EAF01_002579 [Botrytis porri]|uniref:uncharacterized protein n=1 Tax=Botrytis porri TaxID=87229 RepID=UPI001900A3BE|nr:uncharacterized protein EAF01_002579 [Botrytis porri]KAF7911071.1 hypothetical protein EAF01_002579 [Botrytis porri]